MEEKEKSPAVVIKVDEGGRVCVQTEEKDITMNGKKEIATIKLYRNKEQKFIFFFSTP